VVSFREPTQGVIQVEATSEEDAINRVRYDLSDHVTELEIHSIKKIELVPLVNLHDTPSSIN
jgi:hypothetical protein